MKDSDNLRLEKFLFTGILTGASPSVGLSLFSKQSALGTVSREDCFQG